VTTSFARRERLALCDLALNLGPSAPTLCSGWTVADLVAHLLVRERQPWAAGGILVPGLRGLTESATARAASRPFTASVELLRTPPAPLRVPGVEGLVNSIEFFVHHEDVRRAQPGWSPREIGPEGEAALWRSLRFLGRALARPAGVPVVVSDGARSATLQGGTDPVVVTGAVGELTLFLFGRAAVKDLTFDGPTEAVDGLREAALGF
jgi:uncharacterized protein (TIGR03085 family)